MDSKTILDVFQTAHESPLGGQLVKVLAERGFDMEQVESFAQESPMEVVQVFWLWQNGQPIDLKADFKTFHKLANAAPNLTELTFRSYYQKLSTEDQDHLVFNAFLGEDHLYSQKPILKVFSEVEIGEQCFLKIAHAAFTLASPQYLLNRTYPLVSIRSRNLESSRLTLISHASLFVSLDYAPSFWGFIYGLFSDELVSQEQLLQVELGLAKTSWDLEAEAKGWMYAIWATTNRFSVFETIAALLKQNEGNQDYLIAFYETMVNALNCFTDQKDAISSILDWLLSNFHLDLARPHRRFLVDCFDRILENQATLQLPPSAVMNMDSLLMLIVQEQIEDLQFWIPVDSYLQARLPIDEETGFFVLKRVIQFSEIHHSSFLSRIEPFPSLEIINQPKFAAQFQALVESNVIEDILYLFTLFNRVVKEVPNLPFRITSEKFFFRLLMAYRWRSWSMDANAARLFIEFLLINSAIEVPSLQSYLSDEIFRTMLSFKTTCYDRWVAMDWAEPTMHLALDRAKYYFEQLIAVSESEALSFGFPRMNELARVHELKLRSKVLDHSSGMNSILNIFSHVDVIYGNSFSGIADQSSPATMNSISHGFPLNRFLMTKPEGSDIISKHAFKRLGLNHE